MSVQHGVVHFAGSTAVALVAGGLSSLLCLGLGDCSVMYTLGKGPMYPLACNGSACTGCLWLQAETACWVANQTKSYAAQLDHHILVWYVDYATCWLYGTVGALLLEYRCLLLPLLSTSDMFKRSEIGPFWLCVKFLLNISTSLALRAAADTHAA